jgi:DNA repair protein RadC
MVLRELQIAYRPTAVEVPDSPITDPRQAAEACRRVIGDEPAEVLIAVYLDTKHRILSCRQVSRGAISATLASPRDILQGALLANAGALLVAHNHPSGDPTPSGEDRRLAADLAAACRVMGLPLVDFMIIGDSFISFQEIGGF